ncbi:MAG: VPLPA-CTERM sorting domain-containing protein [Gammaproteobacteria bacterium]|nr:VPLPA-CTERM sorting domain-containing protein [Gammaproteobacteria bacterium]
MNPVVTPPPRGSRRLRILAAAIIANGFLASSAPAATLHWLTSPSLVGHVTFDAFLGNSDDRLFSGINTIGAASSFSASNGVYGFFQGTHTTQGQSIFGLQDQQLFGSNVFQSITLTGQWNLNSAFRFNQPFSQSLNTASAHTLTINPDQSYTDSFVANDVGSVNGRIQVTGTGHYLLNGQNPTSLYSGDLLTHFNFVKPLLPTDWQGVAQESQSWTVLDGAFAGVTGFNTLTFYSQDSLATPQQQPVALGAPWVTTGYAAVQGAFQGAGAQIGSPAPPNGPGNDGTASLLSGSTASLAFLNVGIGGVNGGAGVVTIDGAGTQLSVLFAGSTGIFVGHGGSFSVKNGAHVELDGTGGTNNNISVEAFRQDAQLIVDGAGSELRVHGATGKSFISPIEGSTGNNFVSITGGAKGTITNGAKIITEGNNTSGILIGGFPGGGLLSSVAVDGAGSTLDAGSTLVVGSHPVITKVFGPGDPGELVVRNGGVAQATTIYIGTDGTVKGNGGTLQGAVNNHGTIAPGESPGTLTIQGDLVQAADGKLVIEIGGNTPGTLYDVLNVTGKLTLGGTLEIDLLNGFTPGPNDVFDFLHAGSFAGSFSNFILPTFGNGQTLHLNFGANGISALSAVPLPAAVWLLGSALGGLGFYRRRA